MLGDPTARVTSWRHEPIAYQLLNPSSGGIYRFSGIADIAARQRPWTLVLKVTRSPNSLTQDVPLPPSVGEAVRWDRELLAYESGFLPALDGPLLAAAWHGGARHEDATCWLWLEYLDGDAERWSLDDWAIVARALGAFNGRFAASDLPAGNWLGRRWLRVWSLDIVPVLPSFAAPESRLWQDRRVRDAFDRVLRDRLARVFERRADLVREVESLAPTCSHLDAHRRNLFLRRSERRVVAIDWGLAGLAAPGEEIASTLVGTLASGELALEQAAPFAATLYAGYMEGLAEGGWRGDEDEVRTAFTNACALRSLSIIRLDVPDETATLARSAALAAFLLDVSRVIPTAAAGGRGRP